jgi:phosphoribosylformylglycinamidine synthase
VPTVGGEVEFAPAYSGNPLVNAMCVGLIRTENLLRSRAEGEGNLVVLVGSKTGRDGIHGATFASDELSEESEAKRSNVQIGDPFCEKMLVECCLKLLEEDLLVSLQDLGAAGIASSASEMAAKGGVGIEVETDRVPLRESGMEPYEVVISESQERMLAIVEPEKVQQVLETAARYELVGAVIGRVADHGELRVKCDGEVAGSVPAEYLADAPVYERDVVRPPYLDEVRRLDLAEIPEPGDYNETLLRMLAHPNLCSRRQVFEQYDHQVGADTVVLPGADAAVMRIKGTGLGFAVTTDGRGRHCYLDPEGGGAATVAEAYRNLSCVGAEPIALTNCLNFGSPEKTQNYYQLAACIEGMAEACETLGTPVVSGNVSLYNETEAGAVYPTPVVGMVGLLRDVERHATPGFKREGDMVVVIGGRSRASLAGSDYLEIVHGRVAGSPPRPDLAAEKRTADLVRELVRSGLVDTAHDISGGGEVVALAEMALAGGLGVECSGGGSKDMISAQGRADVALFGESPGAIIVAVPPERWDELEDALADGVGWHRTGTVGGDGIRVVDLIDVGLEELGEAYERDLFL